MGPLKTPLLIYDVPNCLAKFLLASFTTALFPLICTAQTTASNPEHAPFSYDSEIHAIYSLNYLEGTLSAEADILKLVQMHEASGDLFRAAKLLNTEIQAGRITSNPENFVWLAKLFQHSRERQKSIEAMLKASEISSSPLKQGEWVSLLQSDYEDIKSNIGGCENAEHVLKVAMHNGYAKDNGWMTIAKCRHEQAKLLKPPSCSLSKEGRSNSKYNQKRRFAISALENINRDSSAWQEAQKWTQFLKNSIRATEARCEFDHHLPRGFMCFPRISQAYEAEKITGVFELADPYCELFLESYDRKYRNKK